jgi:protein-S-isoprenylcysteine O-methyltransferase Ste14
MLSLDRRAWRGVAGFILTLALLILIPAWTIRFREAWIYLVLFSTAVAAITGYFLRYDRALIGRRLDAGPTAERQASQQRIQSVASVTLVAVFVTAGLDHRNGWSPPVDPVLVLTADALVVVGFAMIFATFRENSHASAIVEVEAGQQVVSTGPYHLVRHPMYAGAVVLFLATPIALGSLWALAPAAALSATVVIRLLDEERYLTRHLSGYSAYRDRVRFRLVPGIW